jgi:hypothetical protein
VQAPGYNDATSNITVNPSGFVLLSQNFTTNASAQNTPLTVAAALLDPTFLNFSQEQELRGGLGQVSVALTSSNTGVGTIANTPAVLTGGQSRSTAAAFDPAGAGTATITITAPAGFSTPSNSQHITATVNP